MPAPLPIRERIVANVVAALSGLSGVAVERNMEAEAQAFPLLNVIEGDHTADSSTHGATMYVMAVAVEGFAQAADRADLGPSTNDLYARVVQALAADYTLGGLAVDITETGAAFEPDRTGMETPTAYFAADFQITFFTKQGDPYQVGP